MVTFVDDDQKYLAWVADHPGRYVVNCRRTPAPDYLMLHRASCKSVSKSTRSNWTTGQYIKVCSEDIDDLRRWAADQVGGSLQPCQTCSPLAGPSTAGHGPAKPPVKGGKGGRTVTGGSGSSRFLTVKSVVEFAAALIAVVGGIVAFIKWIL